MPPVAQFSLPSQNSSPVQGTSQTSPSGMPPVAQFSLPGQDNQTSSPSSSGTDNTFSTPLTNIASGNEQANEQEVGGAAKGIGGLLLDVGGADKNPFVKNMTANAGMTQDVAAARKAVQPSNLEQEKGAQGSYLAAGLIAPSEGASAVSNSSMLATRRIASNASTMTAKELSQEASRVLENGKVLPSVTEQRAGEILKGKTFGNPVKTLKSVGDEIASRGKEAETFLETNAKPISNEEDFNAFNSIKDSSEKYMTPAEAKAYEEQIGVFQKILKGYGKYTTPNYYKALKEYESMVTSNLPKGKDALLVPGGSARIQAAKDVRSVVRDMIGEKNPEFKGKMFDLASLYDAKDNVLGQVVDKAKTSASFVKRHPWVTGLLSLGATGLATGLGVGESNAIKGLLNPSGQ